MELQSKDAAARDDDTRVVAYVAPAVTELGTLQQLTGGLHPNYGGELGPRVKRI
jgi:hypothetical protein